ncbi:HYR-like domain-containing protein [Halocola ammonii]
MFTQLSDDAGANGQNGSDSLVVPAGSEIAFIINATDDQLGSAVANVTNITIEATPLECPVVDCFIREFTATDSCGNTSVAHQFFTIQDTTGPEVIEGVEDMIVECDQPVPQDAPVFDDACSEFEVTAISSIVELDCEYEIQRSWTATDSCGNSTTVSQTITIVDTTGPEFTFVPGDLTLECDVEDVPFEPAQAVDNCSEVTITHFDEVVSDSCSTVITRIFTAVDVCGNVTTATQVITIIDTIAPVIEAEIEVDLACDDYDVPVLTSVSDNCDEDLEITYEDANASGGCVGRILRNYTVTDNCGNEAYFEQIITLIDTVAPVFTSFPQDLTINCDDNPPSVDGVEIAFEDNCTEVTLSYEGENIIEGDCPNSYTIERTWIITDNCGNETVGVWTINVEDKTAPVITNVPEAQVLECGNEGEVVLPDATDNCDSSVVVTYADFDLITPWVFTSTSGDGFGEANEDGLTLESSDSGTLVSQIVALTSAAKALTISFDWDYLTTDVDGPAYEEFGYTLDGVFTQLSDNAGANDQSGSASFEVPAGSEIAFIINATDDQLGSAVANVTNITITATPLECPVVDCFIREFTATDSCGNSSVAYQFFTIEDNTAPEVLSAPDDATVECSDELPQVEPVFTDSCDDSLDVVVASSIVPQECGYIINRSWTATDDCGNSTTVDQTITVIDTTSPTVVSAPEDVTIECGEPEPTDQPVFSDNCDEELQITAISSISNNECGYTISRSWTATDDCGNSTSVSQVITVVDTTAPVISGEDSTVELACNVQPTVIEPTVTDNCDEDISLEFEIETIDGDCPNNYTQNYIWTATDACGNSSQRVFTFIFTDTEAPILSATPENLTIECDEEVPAYEITASDNCSPEVAVSFNESVESLDCGYALNRTWSATDECGNTTTHTQVITVTDTTAPIVVSAPEDVTIECDQPEPTDQPVFSDNCDIELELTAISSISAGDCGYQIQKTWSATDDCGNSTSVSQTITVVDTTAPVLSEMPENLTVECDEEIPSYTITATDNCTDTVEVFMAEGLEVLDCGYTLTRTWSAADDCGNTASHTQVITVVDTTAPVIEAEIEVEMSCDNINMANLVSATDNCSEELEISFVDNPASGGCAGRILRNYTVADECGNEAYFEQIITLIDTVAPVFESFPQDLTVECDSEIPSADGVEILFSDNCTDVTLTYEGENIIGGDCPQSYIIERTWTLIDECGNETSAVWTINVQDTTAPVLHGVPADETISCDEALPQYQITATDNCDPDVLITMVSDVVEMDCGAQVIRIWTATDDCGNSSFHTQTITIVDEEAPVAESVPQDVTIECGDPEPTDQPVFSDNCDEELQITAISTISQDTCGYQISRSWTAIDDCGNETTVSQVITVVDTTAPVISGEDSTTELACNVQPTVIEPTVTDNCDEDIELEFEIETIDGDCPNNYTQNYIWTATDACGNSSQRVFTFIFTDIEGPMLSATPENLTIECDEEAPTYEITATDNCSPEVAVVFSEFTEDLDCGYALNRTWSATDECGNTTTHTQVITVTDTTAPVVVSAPEDVTIECDQPEPTDAPVFSDNCDPELELTAISSISAGDCEYQIQKTWTATDDCGNSTSVTQIITVIDTTAPAVVVGVEDLTFECGQVGETGEPQFADNCDEELEIFYATTDIVQECGYQIENVWTAVDNCGNETTVTQVITVVDTTAPVIIGEVEDATVACASDVPAPAQLTAEDNCSGVEFTFSESVVGDETSCEYQIVRTWTATDACENSAQVQQTITVADTEAPVFTAVPEDLTLECSDEIPSSEAFAEDNCGTATVTSVDNTLPSDCPSEYVIERVFTAVDECGNLAYYTQTITVQDTQAPTLSELPEDIVLDCESDLPEVPSITASDVCDGDVDVTFEQTYIGEAPDEEAEGQCMLVQPESPYYNPDWALFLNSFPGGYEYYTLVDGSWMEYEDGSAQITATVVSVDNPNAGWEVSILLENGLPWNQWSTQGFANSYKDDFGIAGDNYEDWIYYIINNEESTLTGWGDFAGSDLSLSHAPSSYYYGYQLGVAANNVNDQYGSGGWFSYDGLFVDASTQFEDEVSGAGDVAFNHDCCPQYEVVWTWTATDCAGNTTTHSINISFEDFEDDVTEEPQGCPGDFNFDGYIGTGDLLMLLSGMGCQQDCGILDVNGDGKVGTEEILFELSVFGTECD